MDSEQRHPQPRTLSYLAVAAESEPAPAIIPAALSLAFGIAAVVFLLGICAGVWSALLPPVARHAGWICAVLSILTMSCAALGAYRAPRESGWYHIAWLSYGIGILVGAFTPLLFL
ncbi:hypothetical protein [Fontivita pretiosa]|uniref:hypothetical protein n=1 Tax=Fontivita pretiosa TaxID=2989684 RepID=UPI003D1698B8